jgi:hypothetical protein
VKDPKKFLLPSSYLVLIALREDKSEDYVSFALLAHVPLHLDHGSAVGTLVSGLVARRPHRWSDSRSQISDRIEGGLVEFVQLFPLQSPMEHFAHITAIPPKVDVILIVGHCVLDSGESAVHLRRAGGKHT